jgi:hypothetical protein
MNRMRYQRMLDKEHQPSAEEMLAHLGDRAGQAWRDVITFVEAHYDFAPEVDWGGRQYGWSIRYRKSGKPLCTLYPERDAFTMLVVLGKKEVEQFEEHRAEYSTKIAELFTSARQFHDGRWLWIRVLDGSDAENAKRLLAMKRKPAIK